MPEPLETLLNDATARLIGRAVTKDDRFGLAVSGGADSMAMLDLAVRCWPGQVEAATVDHGLRAEAADEAAMVGRWCAARGVPHVTLLPDGPIEGNLQAQARALRYRLLERWRGERRLDWLLTAHQADDQIETVLARLGRGAGVGGLASVRARRGVILRPLLGTRRAALRGWCVAHDVPFTDDPSNADPRFDRVRLRAKLAGLDLIDPDGLARSVEALAEADAALEWMAARIEKSALRESDAALALDVTDLPPALLRRLIQRMVARLNPQAQTLRGPSLDQALVQLYDGKSVTLADCIVTGGTIWTVRRAPPRRSVL